MLSRCSTILKTPLVSGAACRNLVPTHALKRGFKSLPVSRFGAAGSGLAGSWHGEHGSNGKKERSSSSRTVGAAALAAALVSAASADEAHADGTASAADDFDTGSTVVIGGLVFVIVGGLSYLCFGAPPEDDFEAGSAVVLSVANRGRFLNALMGVRGRSSIYLNKVKDEW
jgi:hypothetical protein